MGMPAAIDRDQGVKQGHHAAALGPHRLVGRDVSRQAVAQRGIAAD